MASASASNTATVGFEQQIWAAADALRGSMDASECKHVVLGLIFLKYISDKFEELHGELKADAFFVPPQARWGVIQKAAHKEEIGTVIDAAMSAVEKENKRLKDVLPKSYAKGELDKRRLGNVVELLTNAGMSGHGADKDALGRTYEYCLARFAEAEGKRAGEFCTPSCIVKTLVEVLRPSGGRVYDPCCGSGGMFVQSADFAKSHSGSIGSVSFYGQDANPATRRMAIMNLAICGIEADLGGHSADTFHGDLHPMLSADCILADPPFNHSGWNGGQLDDDPRWKYGLPPSGNANFAWLQHMIHHLAPNGRMGTVLANGSLSSQGGGEGKIRRGIVEDGLVEGIVAMPMQLFHTTQMPVTLWFLGRDRKRSGETLFVDARRMGTMVGRRLREMTKEDIAKIAGAFQAFSKGELEGEKGFCAAVALEEIARQDYILAPDRYVGTGEQCDNQKPFDEKMARLTGELSAMFKRSRELEGEVRERLGAIGYEI